MAVFRFRQPIGLDGVAQLVGKVPPVPVHRQGIQEPGLLQGGQQPQGPQQVVEKVQVKLGVVGHQQRLLRPVQQTAEALRRPAVVHALPHQLRIRNASEIRDERRQGLSCRQADQGVEISTFLAVFQSHRADLNDPVPTELDAGGLRVKHHQPVKLVPKLHHAAQFSPVA